MKKRRSNLILVTVFLVGFSLVLYPVVSNHINSRNQSKAIAGYEKALSALTEKDYSGLWQAADAYNARLASNTSPFLTADEQDTEYERLLNPTGGGIMGYVEITSIGVKLPVYHGTSDVVLQIGVGHIAGSSLPAGGEATHCVLSGHRGLPSAKLFTNLDKVTQGDIFLLHILDRVLAYEVDQVLVVEPTDTQALEIVAGKDYCTLVTCTPYGINSQRLLVRGVRVDYKESAAKALKISSDATKIDPILVAPILAVPMLTALLVALLLRTRVKKQKK